MRHDYPYYYHEFDDRILRILSAKFGHSIPPVYSQISKLASFLPQVVEYVARENCDEECVT